MSYEPGENLNYGSLHMLSTKISLVTTLLPMFTTGRIQQVFSKRTGAERNANSCGLVALRSYSRGRHQNNLETYSYDTARTCYLMKVQLSCWKRVWTVAKTRLFPAAPISHTGISGLSMLGHLIKGPSM